MKKVSQNIGILNAFIRLTCGFTMLAWGTSKMAKRHYNTSRATAAFITIMGAMKVAEGITRFCPLTYLFEEGMDKMDVSVEMDESSIKSYDNQVNPTEE